MLIDAGRIAIRGADALIAQAAGPRSRFSTLACS
jgi:hypothetical protein